MSSNKTDPKPWAFNFTIHEIQTIFEFAQQEYLERAVMRKNPEHFHILCILEGYNRLLEKKKKVKSEN